MGGGFGGLVRIIAPGAGGQGLVPPSVLEVFTDEFGARADDFDPREMALAAWALATLKVNPQPDRFDTRFDLGGESIDDGDGVVDSGGGSSVDGGGRARVRVAALEAVEAAAVTRIHEFNPQDFSNLIWAFAKLGHTPGRAEQITLLPRHCLSFNSRTDGLERC